MIACDQTTPSIWAVGSASAVTLLTPGSRIGAGVEGTTPPALGAVTTPATTSAAVATRNAVASDLTNRDSRRALFIANPPQPVCLREITDRHVVRL
jgi:hypothetical protein